MARYKKEHRDQAKAAILDATARRLRKSGFHGVGVDGLMAEAGLTSGAFYSHFASKEALLAEVVSLAGLNNAARLERLREEHGKDWLTEYLKFYLGTGHRDDPETGCSLAALTVDISRTGEPVKEALETSLARMVGTLSEGAKGEDAIERSKNARQLLSLMVGALILSRALPKGAMSEGFLGDARDLADQLVSSGR